MCFLCTFLQECSQCNLCILVYNPHFILHLLTNYSYKHVVVVIMIVIFTYIKANMGVTCSTKILLCFFGHPLINLIQKREIINPTLKSFPFVPTSLLYVVVSCSYNIKQIQRTNILYTPKQKTPSLPFNLYFFKKSNRKNIYK